MNKINKFLLIFNIVFGLANAVVIIIETDNRVKHFFVDSTSFFVAFINEPWRVGAIAPSSEGLADEITKYVKIEGEPKRILEVGAGTGVFTNKLIEKMRTQDHLDVIEIESELCEILEEKFANLPNVDIHCLSILDWDSRKKYDFIVSGVPFNALEPSFLQKILEHYKKLIKNNGILSYFEYIVLCKIKMFFLHGQAKKIFEDTLFTIKDFRETFGFEEKIVWSNLPPAKVHFLKIVK